ncbi:hypothetical protein HZS_3893 [Henneguya salminicola]|nr:hypothetical protein HZS_3893 [Henneguya salminicola]
MFKHFFIVLIAFCPILESSKRVPKTKHSSKLQNFWNFWKKPDFDDKNLQTNNKNTISNITKFTYKNFEKSEIKTQTNHVFKKSCHHDVSVLIVVISKPTHFEIRNVIRRTYGKNKIIHNYFQNQNLIRNYSHCYIFSIGYTNDEKLNQQIDHESIIYEDILKVPLIDTYYYLPHKVMATFYILNNLNKKFDYLLKMDDDILIKTKQLIPAIYKDHQDRQFISYVNAKPLITRDKKNKYYSIYEKHKDTYHFPYPEKSAYIVRRDIISNITSRFISKQIFPFEDVTIGYILKDLNIEIKNYQQMQICLEMGYNQCDYPYVIMIHRFLKNREKYINFYKDDYS